MRILRSIRWRPYVRSYLCYSRKTSKCFPRLWLSVFLVRLISLVVHTKPPFDKYRVFRMFTVPRLKLALQKEGTMDKDRVEGKVKDIAGRVQRQAGEWTGNEKTQAEGAAKQAEGKLQNAWGKVKDAVKPTKSEDEDEPRDRAVNE